MFAAIDGLASEKKAIIIGAGIAGIATAIRLRKKGYEVTIHETNEYPGGKLSEIRWNDYRFDAGPSLFTLPELVDELFILCNKNPRDYFSYHQLPISCKYMFSDGTIINGFSHPIKFAEEIENKTIDSRHNIETFLKKSKRIYDLTSPIFLNKSLHKIRTFLSLFAWKTFFNLPHLDTQRTMDEAIRSYFKDPKTIQLFQRYATYNGSSPFKAPATLNVIPHLEHSLGAFLPKGGMISITNALVQLASDTGVKFQFKSDVKKIGYRLNQVIGIETQQGFYPADIIVSNCDMYVTYKKLLPDFRVKEKLFVQEKSSSALIFYWAMKGNYKDLDVHNIFFTNNYEEEFRHVFETKTIYSDPTIYVYVSSKVTIEDAPPNGENWFVMINVPHINGQIWEEIIPLVKKQIISKLEKQLQIKIEPNILHEDILSPELIESKTSSHLGSLYGNSSNNKYSAFLRHPNFSSKLKNLYFCGGSVHPGGGIPLCLLSAKIVEDCLPS